MPPYGLYSSVNTPEELLQGYKNVTRYDADPAFGNLQTDTRFQPAPYTGPFPSQNMYDLSPTYYGSANMGYDANLFNPSFGGVPGYRDTGGIMDIVDEATLMPKSASPGGLEPLAMMLDPGPVMENVGIGGQIFAPGDPRIKEASNEIAKKNLLQRFTPQAVRTGLSALARTMGAPRIASAVSAPFSGLGNLLTNLQSSTFGRSRSIADYINQRRAQKVAEGIAERGLRKQRDAARTTAKQAMTSNQGYGGRSEERGTSGKTDSPYGGGAGGLHSGY